MRFVKGDNLKHAIDRFHDSRKGFDTVEFRQVLRRFLDVCNAVAFAHSRGVLHRDLKPGNVMLGEFGETLLVDWGLAKVVGRGEPKEGETTLRPSSGSDVVQTAAGSAIGTPSFMSPQQAEGKLEALGPATDVYSLGATLYCLLTGRAPVPDGPLAEVLEKVRRGDILPADRVRADVPKALAAVCGKAMALAPADRYPTALALAQDLEHWLADEPVGAYRDPLSARAGRWARKHRTPVTTAAAALLVALVSVSVGLAVVGGLNGRLEAANGELTRSNAALEASRAEADEKRREAERERNVALAVNEFLQKDLLGQADIGNQPFLGEKVDRNPDITVAELLGRAAKAVEGKFTGQPETEAAVRQTIGLAYSALGKYELAQPQLEWAVAVGEKRLGADHPDTLQSKNYLAMLHRFRGKYDRAEALHLEVLRLREKRLGADHPDTLTSKSNLAALHHDQGKYDRAESLYLETLRQQEKKLGADHHETLGSKNNLAMLYRAQGKYDRAESVHLEVLRLTEKRLGADHPDTLTSKHNLAALYKDKGKYDRAEPLYLEVLKQQEKKLGADHPSTLTSKSNLAALYRAQGKYDRAERLHLEALRLSEKRLGSDHPHTLATKNNLAALYWSMRKLDRSVPLFEEVLRQKEKKLGPSHPETLRTLANLGVNYRDAGRLEEGIRCLEEFSAKARALPGGIPASLAWVPPQLATTYDRGKQFAKAEALYRGFLEDARKQFGADDPRTAGAMPQLGLNLLSQKKYADAEKLLRDCLAIRDKSQPDEWTTFNTRSLLGEALLGQKKHAEAEPLLVQGYEGMEKRATTIPPQGKVRLKEALERLVRLYEATGDKEQAAKWRKKLEEAEKAAKAPKN
jgi:tetratricopeptide (TPR) repeat protein